MSLESKQIDELINRHEKLLNKLTLPKEYLEEMRLLFSEALAKMQFITINQLQKVDISK